MEPLRSAAEDAAKLDERLMELSEGVGKLKTELKTELRKSSKTNRRTLEEASTNVEAVLDEVKEFQKEVVSSSQKTLQIGGAAQKRVETLAEQNAKAMQSIDEQLDGIRKYAAEQHEQVERYQKGFEWTVISDLGKRIFRVMDGIERDMAQAEKASDAKEALQDVRDELLFALESKGIERIRDEELTGKRSSDLRDVVRVRETKETTNPEQDGMIQSVIRPGYRLVLDEQGAGRIVRPVEVAVWKLKQGDAKNES